ncbi:Lrp/AsnC family transcriptional regulator [soil metagenome]
MRNPLAEDEPASRLDEIDEILVWELTRNSRISNAALAEAAGIAPSTCHHRVKALQDAGVLQSYHAQIDLGAVGLPLQAIISIRLHAQARDRVREYAHKAILLPQVINLFYIGGQGDFLVHVACTSSEQLRDVVAAKLSADPIVASTHTSIVFDHMAGVQYMDHVTGFRDVRRAIDETPLWPPADSRVSRRDH